MSTPIEEIKSIEEFLGKERIEDLKDFILEKLKENFEESINNHYVVFPQYFTDLFDDVFDKVSKDITRTYKRQLTEAAKLNIEKQIDNLKLSADDSLRGISFTEAQLNAIKTIKSDPEGKYFLSPNQVGWGLYKEYRYKGELQQGVIVTFKDKESCLAVLNAVKLDIPDFKYHSRKEPI